MSENITNNPSVPTQVVSEVKFPRFINNLGIIPTSYKDSMNYYQNVAWLCKFLEETVIPTVNQNGHAVQELQALYIQLNDYVSHYFDNLDVQKEINKKLDEMASTGVLQNVLSVYFNDLEESYNNQISQFEYEMNNQINTFRNNVTDELTMNETQIQLINNKVDSVASGSPAGVYATVEALQTADPNHSKIYVVTADGKWYYYNNSTTSWTAGGTYQAIDNDEVERLTTEVGELVEFTSAVLSSTNNKVYSLNITAGNTIKVWSTGNINVWTHSNSSVSDTYDVEELGFVSNGTSPKTFTATANASYVRIYASTNATVRVEVMNKRVPVLEGKVSTLESSVSTINTNITDINSNLSEIKDNFIIKENLIEAINTGTFYVAWNINDTISTSSNDNYACGRAKVNGLDYVTINVPISSSYSCYADSSGKKIATLEGTQQGASKVYAIPNNAYYMYISCNDPSYWSVKGLVLMEGQQDIATNPVSATDYPYLEPKYYGDSIKLESGITLGEALDPESVSRKYYVMKDGTGDYNKLTDAIQEAIRYKNSVVYVGPGTWDIIDEFGSEEMETMGQNKRGLYLQNNIRVICSSKALITANYEGSNANVIEWFSAFNSGPYGFTLENATIESSNIRYAIHDERESNPDRYINKYINCRIKHTNGYYRQCIGGGLGLDGYIIIKDCVFKGTPGSPYTNLVSYHNSGDGHWEGTDSQNAQSFIDIDGNYFEDNGTIELIKFGKSEKVTTVLIHGNSLGASVIVRNGSAYYYDNISKKEYNNEIRS